MKVCPVQKFGLDAVLTEYQASGQILGKDTDELEGYDWPVDGKHYPPGARPRIAETLIAPAELRFDPARLAPPPEPSRAAIRDILLTRGTDPNG
jgi:hypothetical protein